MKCRYVSRVDVDRRKGWGSGVIVSGSMDVSVRSTILAELLSYDLVQVVDQSLHESGRRRDSTPVRK